MPIKQDRMIALIQAGQAAISAFDDLRGQVTNSIALRQHGIISEAELINQITGAFYTTMLPAKHLVVLAREEQHFKDCAARNNYASNRLALRRGGAVMPPRVYKGKQAKGMIKLFDAQPAELAMAQQGGLAGIPTPDQVAEDQALINSMEEDEDIRAEMEKHRGLVREDK